MGSNNVFYSTTIKCNLLPMGVFVYGACEYAEDDEPELDAAPKIK